MTSDREALGQGQHPLIAIDEIAIRLRRALVAAYGTEVGVEAAADAVAWAWEHREELTRMTNPAGYLYRVGQSAARRYRAHPIRMPEVTATTVDEVVIDPRLPAALEALSVRQRAAVLLVHAHGYGLVDAAGVLGISVSALRNHLHRGLRHLRTMLGEEDDV
jgi:DNA-directed RNA polymerase specialized sigma24 family protein